MRPLSPHLLLPHLLLLLLLLVLALLVPASSSPSSPPPPPSTLWGALIEGESSSSSTSTSNKHRPPLDPRTESLENCLPRQRPQALQWSQEFVEDNGGTILALAGRDYCIVAADTRLSSDYRIRTRNVSRLLEVSSQTFIGMAGSWADVTALRREMAYELGCFEARHGRAIGTRALGTFLSNRLYLHRLQPMYALNLVAGLDAQGRGAVFSYDVIGSYNRVSAACCGRGQELMQPVLDQFIPASGGGAEDDGNGNSLMITEGYIPLSCEEAVRVVKDAFISGAEREISIGDGLELVIMKKGEARPRVEFIELPRH